MLKQTRKIVYIALIVIVALAVVGAIYLSFFYVPSCQNYECWQKYMSKCSKATFINEEAEASWGYEITGMSGKQCLIDVTLLLAKQGDLSITNLVNEKMTCSYLQGMVAYAEKDLSRCHGILKEDLQTLMINKLHSYILENLGTIGEGLNKAI